MGKGERQQVYCRHPAKALTCLLREAPPLGVLSPTPFRNRRRDAMSERTTWHHLPPRPINPSYATRTPHTQLLRRVAASVCAEPRDRRASLTIRQATYGGADEASS